MQSKLVSIFTLPPTLEEIEEMLPSPPIPESVWDALREFERNAQQESGQ